MSAPAPAEDLQRYAERVHDWSRDLTEIEVRRATRAFDAALERVSDRNFSGTLYLWKANAHFRLGQYVKAAEDCRLALQRLREPGEERGAALTTQAAAFVMSGRIREAVSVCVEALAMDGPHKPICFGNLAEALHRLGEPDFAQQSFADALECADLADPVLCFKLAVQAAEIGDDAAAVELFARSVRARRAASAASLTTLGVLRSVTEEEAAALRIAPKLAKSLRRAIAMADELDFLATAGSAPAVDDLDSRRDTEDVLEATRRLREDAIAHVLGT